MAVKEKPRAGAQGFTLLEILLSLAFITIVATLPFLFGRFSLSSNNLLLAEQVTVQGLRQAQAFAIAEKWDGGWGVKILSDQIIIFQGDSFATREEDHDSVVPFQGNFEIAGPDEVLFEKFTGEPDVVGDITLSDDDTTHTITLFTHGLLDY